VSIKPFDKTGSETYKKLSISDQTASNHQPNIQLFAKISRGADFVVERVANYYPSHYWLEVSLLGRKNESGKSLPKAYCRFQRLTFCIIRLRSRIVSGAEAEVRYRGGILRVNAFQLLRTAMR
jgi:hypothetical protein